MNNSKPNDFSINYSSLPISYDYPVRDSLYIVVPLTVIYSLIFLTGMVGNVITCVVISRNKSMHTATNYYLFSLAVSDLLLLLSGLPQEIYNMWYRYPYPFNEAVCVLQGFAAETSANATVLTITAFTVERYVAICHPFLSHTMSKLSRAVKFVLGIWIIAMCLAIPQILDVGITKHDTCTVKRALSEPEGINKHVFTISTVLVFVFPMAVISILYILIGLQLHRSEVVKRGTTFGSSVRIKRDKFKKISQQPNNVIADEVHHSVYDDTNIVKYQSLNTTTGNNNHTIIDAQIMNNTSDDGRINYSNKAPLNMGTKHVVNMLVAVVVAFFICWAPHHAQRLFAIYGNAEDTDHDIDVIYYYLTYISGILYFVSTCINPFLYNIMSHKFREAFKETLAKYLYRRSRPELRTGRLTRDPSQRSNSNSHSTNTCSTVCSVPHHQLRYLETDLVHLKTSKRPMVVSFKRIPKDNSKNKTNIKNLSPSIAMMGVGGGYSLIGEGVSFADPKRCASFSMAAQLPNGIVASHMAVPPKRPVQTIANCHGHQNVKSTYHRNCDGANAMIQSSASHTSESQRSLNETDLRVHRKSLHYDGLRFHSPILWRRCSHHEASAVQVNEPNASGDAVPLNEYNLFDSINHPYLYDNEQLRSNNISNIDFSNSFQLECANMDISSKHSTMQRRSGPVTDKVISFTSTAYKSPYDSPELSASSKQLEENLQQILEGLVLYPKGGSTATAEHTDRPRTVSLQMNSKIMRKCKSVPTLLHLFSQRGDGQSFGGGSRRLYGASRLNGCEASNRAKESRNLLKDH